MNNLNSEYALVQLNNVQYQFDLTGGWHGVNDFAHKLDSADEMYCGNGETVALLMKHKGDRLPSLAHYSIGHIPPATVLRDAPELYKGDDALDYIEELTTYATLVLGSHEVVAIVQYKGKQQVVTSRMDDNYTCEKIKDMANELLGIEGDGNGEEVVMLVKTGSNRVVIREDVTLIEYLRMTRWMNAKSAQAERAYEGSRNWVDVDKAQPVYVEFDNSIASPRVIEATVKVDGSEFKGFLPSRTFQRVFNYVSQRYNAFLSGQLGGEYHVVEVNQPVYGDKFLELRVLGEDLEGLKLEIARYMPMGVNDDPTPPHHRDSVTICFSKDGKEYLYRVSEALSKRIVCAMSHSSHKPTIEVAMHMWATSQGSYFSAKLDGTSLEISPVVNDCMVNSDGSLTAVPKRITKLEYSLVGNSNTDEEVYLHYIAIPE